MSNGLRLVWVGLSYPPTAGGAAQYAHMMATTIDSARLCERLVFLVGKHANEWIRKSLPNGISEIRRVFTTRAARSKKDALSYILFLVDNLKLLNVLRVVRQESADAVIVHGWYLLRPSVLWLLLPILKSRGIKLVADLRDTFLGEDGLRRLEIFDRIVCCGRNVEDLVQKRSSLAAKAFYVPVPLNGTWGALTATAEDKIMRDNSLVPGRYIFSPTGVDDGKRFRLLFEAWLELDRRGAELDLVIAGRPRDWRKEYDHVDSKARVVLVGNIGREELHSLYSQSAISVNVSKNESFGRVPLEALPLDIPMILPSGVPEFDALSSDLITKDDPISVAEQIQAVLKSGAKVKGYDLSIHDVRTVCAQTVSIIAGMFEKDEKPLTDGETTEAKI
ncbi:MAG: hypothetical protein CMP77_16955 [Flavobacterium sp.]|nr:hypothetical protein [Flavobacterium sp.]